MAVRRASLLAANQSIVKTIHVDRWEGVRLAATIPSLVLRALISQIEGEIASNVLMTDSEAVTANVEAIKDALVNVAPARRTRLFVSYHELDDWTSLPVASHLVHAIQLVEAGIGVRVVISKVLHTHDTCD